MKQMSNKTKYSKEDSRCKNQWDDWKVNEKITAIADESDDN